MLPTARQARKVVWQGINDHGRMIDQAYPAAIRDGKPNDTEMLIRLKCGSHVQMVGSDNFDSLVGTNPRGIVFSEYSLTDPRAWEYMRPILRENGGWALFIYTFRGHNHGWNLYKQAQKWPDWFVQRLTVVDTGMEHLADAERKEGMSEEMVQQEYYCNPDAPLHGAYYAAQLMQAQKDGRIGKVPYDPAALVHTRWDLGVSDATAVWFFQRVGRAVHFIDHVEHRGVGIPWYADMLAQRRKEFGYAYGKHLFPHDMRARDLSVGEPRNGIMERLLAENGAGGDVVIVGTRPITDRGWVQDGIEAARREIGISWFDADKCERGIEALRSYHEDYEEDDSRHGEDRFLWTGKPAHDWSSHSADAHRVGAIYDGFEFTTWKPIKYGRDHISASVI